MVTSRMKFVLTLLLLMLTVSCGRGFQSESLIQPNNVSGRAVLGSGLVGTIPTSCSEDVLVLGTTLYVADGPAGLKVVDITLPSKPVLLKSIPTTYAIRVYVYENYLYLCDGPAGIKVFSLSNPRDPVMTFSADSEWATSAAFRDGYLYLGDYFGGMEIYDVGNPASPVFVTNVKRSRIRDITFSGNTLLASDAPFGLAPYFMVNPTTPELVYTDGTRFGNFEDVVGYGKYAIIARNDDSSNVDVFDIGDLADIAPVDEKLPARFIDGLSLAGDRLLVSCGEDGVIAYDLLTLPDMVRLWRLDTPGYARRAKIFGDYLFVADMSSVGIYFLNKTGGQMP
jgi:hypothetical protein